MCPEESYGLPADEAEIDELAAGFNALPMGQWFGGRSVSMAGVHAVGVSPEQRGKGVAARPRAAGLLEGSEDDLRRAATVFAGPAPWMPDMF